MGLCVRNEKADVLQAQAKAIEDPLSINTQVEALAILQAMRYIGIQLIDRIVTETDYLLLKNITEPGK